MKKQSLFSGLVSYKKATARAYIALSALVLLSGSVFKAEISKSIVVSPGEIQIGNQVWTTRNLDVDTFRNGEVIPEVKSKVEWQKAGLEKRPAWCYYKNDAGLGKKYGRMYNWYALHDPRGIIPQGWHLPKLDEWIALENFVGQKAAQFLLNCRGEQNFCAQAGGYRSSNGNFTGMDEFTYLSGASEDELADSTKPKRYFIWGRGLHFVDSTSMRCGLDKEFGLYVRCIKD